jgi:hypothetical protein
MTEPMVWFTFEKLIYTMSKQSCESRIVEQVALDIHDGIAFGLIVPHSGIKLAGENEGGLCTSVPEAPGVLKDGLRRIVRRVCGACHDDTRREDEGKFIGGGILGQSEPCQCERIWNLAVGEGLFGKFEETTTTFLRQRINMDRFGRLGDELGDGGEFEAGSCPGWLESDWKHWTGSLSESGQGVGG